jgi:Methyltransferase domain
LSGAAPVSIGRYASCFPRPRCSRAIRCSAPRSTGSTSCPGWCPEFRTLPPNHLRIRIGVGNRILNNQTHFLVHARDFWMFVFSKGIANMHSDILDVGVGCGRWAHWLRDYNFRGRRFAGSYVGVDIDEEAIAWCRQHYDADRFRF